MDLDSQDCFKRLFHKQEDNETTETPFEQPIIYLYTHIPNIPFNFDVHLIFLIQYSY